MKSLERFTELLKKNNIELSDPQIKQFLVFKNRIEEKNKVLNLTAIKGEDEFFLKHFIDSILMGQDYEKRDLKVLDLGTGGGFPGIPLKLVHPSWQITLVDATKKKVDAVNEFLYDLQLKDAQAVKGRAEELGHESAYRESFDLVFSRAVAALNVLCEYALPFVKIGGCMVASKGPNYQEELDQAKEAIALLGGKVTKIHPFALKGETSTRCLIEIKKVRPTPKKYPRNPGTPAKKPL